jgi:hypothetical protein
MTCSAIKATSKTEPQKPDARLQKLLNDDDRAQDWMQE